MRDALPNPVVSSGRRYQLWPLANGAAPGELPAPENWTI